MGIKYSSYKRKEFVKKKNINEFYNLIENSNHGIVMLNEKYEICLYNPEIRRLCGLSPKEITSNVGNSPVKNNKPGGQGLLSLYQPQYKISAFMLIKAIIIEINKSYTAKTIFLLQNKKNPENIFFGQSYLRRIQIEKQTLILVSFFPIKDTPFIDPYHSENEATIKKIKIKKSKESNTNNKNNTKEKNKKVKESSIQKKTKKKLRHSDRYIYLSKETNFDPRNKYQPSIIELYNDSDTDQNNNPLNDYENSNYTDDDKENSYGSWVEPLTDFENEPQKNSLHQNQNLNQTNNIQNQDQMVFLTNAFVMSKLIEFNNSNSNSSSRKKTKVFPKELNSKNDSFKGGSFNNIKKNRKNKKSNQKIKTNKKNSNSTKSKKSNQKRKTKSKTTKSQTTTNNKNNIQNKSTDNSKTNKNINHNINNTTINKTNNNNTINKNIKTVINNSNTVKNTRDNKIHSNPNNNKNNIDNNNTSNNKSTINNNVLKNRKTVKNIIYKFVINDDQKPEAYLENILPCSKEIDNIFQDYESESNSSDSQLD
ncbi:DNAj heat shock n-terminal domain-containing protein [Anaeramoeba flamelloides]|uniref:DNAj heat shock n-terminal domain-containing protein n=1 Tax=Anaeramoeba flamelloides TaxID=1746091 RepID=A0ABQ8XWP9_9EUKA|nr:DNAj heat shock n-terminal domain-containing protein [Anaeramoeba flamelloides]